MFLCCVLKPHRVYGAVNFLHEFSQSAIRTIRFLVETFRSTQLQVPSILEDLINFHKRSPKAGIPCSGCSSCLFISSVQRGFLLVRTELFVVIIVYFRCLCGCKEDSPNMVDVSW